MNDSTDTRICFIGDSFVNGTGDPEHLGWVGRLFTQTYADTSHITIYNLAIRGNTSADIRNRWQNECATRLPGHTINKLVFSFGVNDTSIDNNEIRVSEQCSVDNTRNILQQATKKYEVLMVGPPPVDDTEHNNRIRSLDSAYQSVCKDINVSYLSVFEDLLNDPVWLKEISSNDGAHPGSAGYHNFALLIKSWSAWCP